MDQIKTIKMKVHMPILTVFLLSAIELPIYISKLPFYLGIVALKVHVILFLIVFRSHPASFLFCGESCTLQSVEFN